MNIIRINIRISWLILLYFVSGEFSLISMIQIAVNWPWFFLLSVCFFVINKSIVISELKILIIIVLYLWIYAGFQKTWSVLQIYFRDRNFINSSYDYISMHFWTASIYLNILSHFLFSNILKTHSLFSSSKVKLKYFIAMNINYY